MARRKRTETAPARPDAATPRRRGRPRKNPAPTVESPKIKDVTEQSVEAPPVETAAERPEETPSIDKPVGRPAAAPRTSAVTVRQAPDLVAAEAELVRKYPDRKIVRGSLKAAGAVTGFGHKRTLIIRCENCDTERRVATSDVFHVRFCVACKKQARKAKKKAKNGAQPAGEGASS